MKHERTNRKKENVGIFLVVEDAENNIGIYKDFGHTHVTSRTEWNKSLEIAKLMDMAHKDGYQQGYKKASSDIEDERKYEEE